MFEAPELHYSKAHIKKLTAYLDVITHTITSRGKENQKGLTMSQRAFVWYYVHNAHNAADAYRRAYYAEYDKKQNKLYMSKDYKTPSIKRATDIRAGVQGKRCLTNSWIKDAIKVLHAYNLERICEDMGDGIIKTLTDIASVDITEIVDEQGEPRIPFEDMTHAQRMAIDSVERKFHGKDAERETVTIKVIPKMAALKELKKLAPILQGEGEKHTVVHKTIDKDGNETGFSKFSTAELEAMINKGKE